MVVLEVPEGTVDIPEFAYKRRTDITEVRFPASVRTVGKWAFAECTGITALHFADGLRSIGTGAFDGCSGIKTLHLPDGLESIGNSAFAACRGITAMRLPASLTRIDNNAFVGCSGIKALHLPDGLEHIGAHAFYRCGITSLVLPAALSSIAATNNGGDDAGPFQGCASLARVLAPDALAKGGMADPAKVFQGCPVLAPGLTPFSAVKPPRRRFWHPTMHAWCTPAAKVCITAVLVAELRVDASAGTRRSRRFGAARPLPSLPHELWLLILEFVARQELGGATPA